MGKKEGKSNTGRIIIGIAIVVISVCWALSTLNIATINLLFDGWWTLFVIVPCLINLFTDKHKAGSALGLGLGILMMMAARDVITWSQFFELGLALIGLVGGISIIIFGFAKEKPNNSFDIEDHHQHLDGKNIKEYNVTFGQQSARLDNEVFEGAQMRCRFGAMQLDLRQATITNNSVLKIDCAFGAVEVLLPENVNVKQGTENTFGGVEDSRKLAPTADAPVLYVDGKVSFAGVEIKS